MFTLALYNKNISPAAAVYSQSTNSWRLVKNFAEEPICEKPSNIKLTVASSVPHLDISPDELFTMLGTIQTGIDLLADHMLQTVPDMKGWLNAVPTAVAQMFQGFRTEKAYTGTAKHTLAVTHGGTSYYYNVDQREWQFSRDELGMDGEFRQVCGDHAYWMYTEEFCDMVAAYLNAFPINSSGVVGALYTMATC